MPAQEQYFNLLTWPVVIEGIQLSEMTHTYPPVTTPAGMPAYVSIKAIHPLAGFHSLHPFSHEILY